MEILTWLVKHATTFTYSAIIISLACFLAFLESGKRKFLRVIFFYGVLCALIDIPILLLLLFIN